MYIPKSFEMNDTAHITQLIQDHGFATLIHLDHGIPMVSHVPLYLDVSQQKLTGHLAKKNPHSDLLDASEAYAIFHGPHDYISTENHFRTQGVPTWNYATVHVRGRSSVIHDDALITKRITELLHQYEETALNTSLFNQLKGAIVFFEIAMDHVEAKFKLSQNRTVQEQQRTIVDLQKRNPALASLMQKVLFESP